MTRTPFTRLSTRRAAGAAVGAMLLLAACSADQAVSQADRAVEPTAIPAPIDLAADGRELTLTVVDGGEATGRVLTDHRGFAVYGLRGETTETIVCDDDCTAVWVPVRPRTGGVADGLDASKYSIIERPDGSAQVAYGDIPLYSWTGDSEVGITGGAGVAGTWFALTSVGGQLSE